MRVPRFGTGVYGLRETASFAHVPTQTARRWFFGRNDSRSGPVLRPDFGPVNTDWAISFHDLIDLLVVGRFREQGVSLQTIRKVYQRLQSLIDGAHPFASHRLLTDGRKIFVETCEGLHDPLLQEVLSGQHAFPKVLRGQLNEVDYEEGGLAIRWRAFRGVVLDPKRSFGKPIVEKFGVPTAVLASSYAANGRDYDLVSSLYSVTAEAVRVAVEFEQNLAA